jgi:hypothetical protein
MSYNHNKLQSTEIHIDTYKSKKKVSTLNLMKLLMFCLNTYNCILL